MSKDLIWMREKFKKINIIRKYNECLTFIVLQKKTKEHNPKWPEIPDHPYRILIIGGSESGKINVLLNLINHEPDIDKIY